MQRRRKPTLTNTHLRRKRVVTNTCGDDATEVMERDRQEDKEKYSDGSELADDGKEEEEEEEQNRGRGGW